MEEGERRNGKDEMYRERRRNEMKNKDGNWIWRGRREVK